MRIYGNEYSKQDLLRRGNDTNTADPTDTDN